MVQEVKKNLVEIFCTYVFLTQIQKVTAVSQLSLSEVLLSKFTRYMKISSLMSKLYHLLRDVWLWVCLVFFFLVDWLFRLFFIFGFFRSCWCFTTLVLFVFFLKINLLAVQNSK